MVPDKKIVEKVVYIIHYFFTYNSISLSCFYLFLLPPPRGIGQSIFISLTKKIIFMLNNNCLNSFIAGSFIGKTIKKKKQYCLSTSIYLTPFLMRKDSFQTETASRFAMANSFIEKRLQGIMVFVFINTNIQSKMMKTTTMIPKKSKQF